MKTKVAERQTSHNGTHSIGKEFFHLGKYNDERFWSGNSKARRFVKKLY